MDASITGSTSFSIEEVNNFEQDNQSISASVYDLPKGERSWIPFVSPKFKPYVRAKFRTLDEVVFMYEEYAQMAGFCTRLGTTKKPKGSSDYEIYGFEEVHNHGPLSSHHLTKKRRKLDFATKEFISNFRLRYTGAIADGDAQMVVDKFNERSKNVHNFTFKYRVVGTELTSLFWADNVSKVNYKAFGDVLAFDVTYHTNMYDMIFVPFTCVDHHKKCTVFGAGLLSNETVEKNLTFVTVFQIDVNLLNNSNLSRSIHKLVLNVYIDLETFERRWNQLMNEYGLQDHEWLSEMYAIRDQWVPGYFRDVPMCCLMKTTSRFQKEMYNAMRLCYIVSREESSNIHSYVVAHQNHLKHIVNEYKVILDTSDFIVTCECLGFTCIGYLCRHAFCIYRHHKVDKIPMKYINMR
ncbi:protein FAR1-RELATED SEQUENCE 3-like [Bidens hawaiensis]|uniref:protein FAR1-RELATED SEQUENCE 3-like n=1 Tax=Bidens hawaiensis TaxID=980011 RepID=UPI00404A17C7